jgi:hypothetical protein
MVPRYITSSCVPEAAPSPSIGSPPVCILNDGAWDLSSSINLDRCRANFTGLSNLDGVLVCEDHFLPVVIWKVVKLIGLRTIIFGS